MVFDKFNNPINIGDTVKNLDSGAILVVDSRAFNILNHSIISSYKNINANKKWRYNHLERIFYNV